MQDPIPSTPLLGPVEGDAESSLTTVVPTLTEPSPASNSVLITPESTNDAGIPAVSNNVVPFDIRRPKPIPPILFPDHYAEGFRSGGIPTTKGNVEYMLNTYGIYPRAKIAGTSRCESSGLMTMCIECQRPDARVSRPTPPTPDAT